MPILIDGCPGAECGKGTAHLIARDYADAMMVLCVPCWQFKEDTNMYTGPGAGSSRR
jgi:hypothetical protein